MIRASLVAAIALLLAPVAHATPASGMDVRALARQALHDPAALATLRRVDVVDGRPMVMARVLAVHGATLDARLRELASSGTVVSTAAATADAQRILAGRRYRGSSVPRPLHRPIAWLGGKAGWVGRQLARPFYWLGNELSRLLGAIGLGGVSGHLLGWLLMALVVAAVVVVLAQQLRRRAATQSIVRSDDPRSSGRGDDPDTLEAAADQAERSGELERALRLRFRAGLLRLAGKRAIPARASLTTGQVRRLLDSPEFDALALTFDEVVYGGRNARPDDLVRARATWPAVVTAARSR